MYFSQEAFEENSLFGGFGNQLKFNEYNLNEKFQYIQFQTFCDHDVKWFNPFIDKVYDKEHKLSRPYIPHDPKRKLVNYHISGYKPPDLEHIAQPSTSKKDTKPVEKEIEPTVEPVEHAQAETHIDHYEQEKPAEKSPPGRPDSASPDLLAKKNVRTQYFDQATYKLLKNWYPFRFKLPYPKKSLLSSQEQKEFIELNNKYRLKTKVSVHEVKFYKKYLHYKNLVEKEKKEFMVYSKNYFDNAQENYEYINSAVAKYVNELIQYLDSSVNSYDKFYAKLNEFSLSLVEHTNDRPLLNFQKSLVQLGNLNKIILPQITLEIQPSLTIDYANMSKRAPVAKNKKKLSKIPLHEDPNAEKLALKYKCSIVMTNSSFVYLIYHLARQNIDSLKMPLIVKSLKDADGSEQKVVFLEKPFVEKPLSMREKNEKFYKRSLMVSLVKQSNLTRSKIESRTRQNKREYAQEKRDEAKGDRILESLNVDYSLINDMDTFGFLDKKSENKSLNVSAELNKSVSNAPEPILEKKDESVKQDLEKTLDYSTEESAATIKPAKKVVNLSGDEYSSDENESMLIIDQIEEEKGASPTKKPKLNQPDAPVEKKIEEIDYNPESPKMETESFDLGNIKPVIIPLDSKKEAVQKPEDKPVPQTSQSVSNDKKFDPKKVDTEEKLSLFDLISKMQEKLINAPQASNLSNMTTQIAASLNAQLDKDTLSYAPENVKEYTYIENVHDNLNYTLWTLNLHKPIKILVRSSTDGYVNTETSSFNSIVLHPKLEYQPQFGCEKLSVKDYAKMWSKSFIRNCCDVFLCRVNVYMNKLISVSKLKHNEILPNDCEFNPNHALNQMRSLFEKFIHLEDSNYLITKEPNDDKLNILKSTQSRSNAFDLHFYYNGFIDEKAKPPVWLPIDPELYLPYHIKLNRVPALFEPLREREKNSPKNNTTPPKKKYQRRKKSKTASKA